MVLMSSTWLFVLLDDVHSLVICLLHKIVQDNGIYLFHRGLDLAYELLIHLQGAFRVIMQMQHTVSYQGELIGREKVPYGTILQQFLQDNDHLVGFFIIVLDRKAEKCLGEGLFRYIDHFAQRHKALLYQLGIGYV